MVGRFWTALATRVRGTVLQDEQCQSWTISIFFLRVPLRVTWTLPQCGQLSGLLSEVGPRKRDSWLRWSPAPRQRRWRGSRT